MSSTASRASEVRSLKGKKARRFYEAIVLNQAMAMTCHSVSPEKRETPQRYVAPSTAKEQFQMFVYKLAYVCAYDKGRDTVSAVAVVEDLHADRSILYLFAGNLLGEAQGLRVKQHMEELLREVANAGPSPTALARLGVLAKILLFNRCRIQAYLKALASNATKLLKKEEEASGSLSSLELLKQFADVTENGEISAKSTARDFLSACIKCLRNVQRVTGDIRRLQKRSAEGSTSHGEASEILHSLSRILAYHQAMKCFFQALQQWPELFSNPSAFHVPSSTLLKNPLGKSSFTAEAIIGRMTSDREIMELYRRFALDMQKFDIDGRIQMECAKPSFMPLIHCEILIHDWITHTKNAGRFVFFNGWKYIGASKPPCRLCTYYVDAAETGIGMRPSHNNIYANWRLPDAHGPTNLEAKRWQDILNSLCEKIREDAFRIMREKTARVKRHDSNTYDIRSRSSMAVTQALHGGEPEQAAEPGNGGGGGDMRTMIESLGNRLASQLSIQPAAHLEREDDHEVGGASLKPAHPVIMR